MSIPVLTFFNNKGGVGKTSLVYHLAWMFSEMGKRIVAIDLDPQANLTSAFLPEEELELLWDPDNTNPDPDTVFQCVRPLTEVGDILPPRTKRISPRLHLVPGDLGLAGFEDFLSQEWPNSLGSGSLYRPFRVLTAFWQVAQMAAQQTSSDLILADVGPNLARIGPRRHSPRGRLVFPARLAQLGSNLGQVAHGLVQTSGQLASTFLFSSCRKHASSRLYRATAHGAFIQAGQGL
jgi:hypothetical protein